MLDAKAFVDEQLKKIKARIGNEKAIIACSGGVDSMVCAVLTSKAIGDKLLAVFVDTGLMRKDEPDQVRSMLEELNVNFKILGEEEYFLEGLKGVDDPEKKRKIVGERFIRCFEREARAYGAKYLVQGTIAPDVIESGTGGKGLVKSHHNVGGLPEDMDLKLVEPVIDLFKEDVRQVARYLGIKVSERQPFPGPGLSVRCLGAVTKDDLAIVREACFIVEDEIKKASDAGKMTLPWQYFAALLPTRSTGVRDGGRMYGKTVAVRAVMTKDAISAAPAQIPYEVLSAISERITAELGDKVTRVVYDITTKPPATIEWE
jgi:GMP synthase (glutamine-hydrolysing)